MTPPDDLTQARPADASGGERQKRKKAVALKYDPATHAAPVVVAKGQGAVAEQIVQRAREAGVPVQDDPSLVEVLSKLDLNEEIPPELYRLVAEILSFVYRSDRMAGERKANRN